MPNLIYQYDPTGSNSNNLITDEEHQIQSGNGQDNYFIVPEMAPFFRNNLAIQFTDGISTVNLQEGIDYNLVLPSWSYTKATGMYVFGAISLNGSTRTGTIILKYQTLGGSRVVDKNSILTILNNQIYNLRTTTWDEVTNIPEVFPPINHTLSMNKLYGMQDLNSAIESLASTVGSKQISGISINLFSMNILGPSVLEPNTSGLYTIVDYNPSNTYTVTATNGTVSINIDGVITYTAPNVGIAAGFYINDEFVPIVTTIIATPEIVYPGNFTGNLPANITVTSSPFSSNNPTDTQGSSNWEIATDSAFNNIAFSSMNSTTNLTSWNVSGLIKGVVYYLRVQYVSLAGVLSSWSPVVVFSTGNILPTSINTPSIITPINGQDINTNSYTITSSAFTVANGTDTQASSNWELATDSGFTNIVQQSLNDTVNLSSWSVSNLAVGTAYYVRVQYMGSSGLFSNWSNASVFYTEAINTPSIISPSNNAIINNIEYIFLSSAFTVTNGTDTQAASNWEIAIDSGFTNIAFSSMNSTTNLTSWTVTGLVEDTVYYVRVQYISIANVISSWSPTITFSTENISTPTITNPTNGSTINSSSYTIQSSSFSMSSGTDTQVSSNWELATDSGFTNIVQQSLNDYSNLISWTVGGLLVNTTYYVRVQYNSNGGYTSQWSPIIDFKTPVGFYPTTLVAGFTYQDIGYDYSNSGTPVPTVISTNKDGTVVAIGGTWIYANGSYFYTSEALIYELINGVWTQTATLYTNPQLDQYNGNSSSTGYYFNCGIHLNEAGTICYAAASNASTPNSAPVTIFIYTNSGGTWSQTDTISVVSPQGGYENGFIFEENNSLYVNKNDDTLIFFAPIVTGENGGSQYYNLWIYKNNSGTWSQSAVITLASYNTTGWFGSISGRLVALDSTGTIAIVGKPTVNGSASIYTYNGSVWNETATLAPSNGSSTDWFGTSVDMNDAGTVAIIGAPGAYTTTAPYPTGSAYIFTNSGGTWSQTAELAVSSPGYYSGNNVAIDSTGTIALVTQYNYGSEGTPESFIFTNNNGTWTQSATLSYIGNPVLGYGYSADLSKDGTTAVVNSSGSAGSVYGAADSPSMLYVYK